jgi:hypothetical protein
MSTHVLQSRAARATTPAAPTLAPTRAFAARDAAGDASAAPAGHDFGRISVGPAEAAPIQRVKKHHNPIKKKYLAKGVGAQQVAVAQQALAIKQAQPQGQQISNKEAARLAKAALRG